MCTARIVLFFGVLAVFLADCDAALRRRNLGNQKIGAGRRAFSTTAVIEEPAITIHVGTNHGSNKKIELVLQPESKLASASSTGSTEGAGSDTVGEEKAKKDTTHKKSELTVEDESHLDDSAEEPEIEPKSYKKSEIGAFEEHLLDWGDDEEEEEHPKDSHKVDSEDQLKREAYEN